MADKDLLNNCCDLNEHFTFDDVYESADQVLTDRTKQGKEYAVLKFLQQYCVRVPENDEWETFRHGDPRSKGEITRCAKTQWRYTRCPVASTNNEEALLPSNLTHSDGASSLDESQNSLFTRKDSNGKELSEAEICREFVDYLASKPFRKFLGRAKGWYPEAGPVFGWKNRLESYTWPMKSANPKTKDLWSANKKKIEVFIHELRSLRERSLSNGGVHQQDWPVITRIYKDIIKWGNPRGSQRDPSELAVYLTRLWANADSDYSTCSLEVDSTLTKLYAFAMPDCFVIYDTRVAAAIVDIAEDLFRVRTKNKKKHDELDDFRKIFPSIGHMSEKSSGGSSVRRRARSKGWPQAYGDWRAQLDANKLLRGIRDELNARKEGNRSWTLREVEAVLFMEGY